MPRLAFTSLCVLALTMFACDGRSKSDTSDEPVGSPAPAAVQTGTIPPEEDEASRCPVEPGRQLMRVGDGEFKGEQIWETTTMVQHSGRAPVGLFVRRAGHDTPHYTVSLYSSDAVQKAVFLVDGEPVEPEPSASDQTTLEMGREQLAAIADGCAVRLRIYRGKAEPETFEHDELVVLRRELTRFLQREGKPLDEIDACWNSCESMGDETCRTACGPASIAVPADLIWREPDPVAEPDPVPAVPHCNGEPAPEFSAKLRSRKPKLAGEYPARIVPKVINQHVREIKHCALLANACDVRAAAKMSVDMKWTIDGSGNVASATVTGGDDNAELRRCLVEAVRAWRFPATRGGHMVLVSHRFELTK